MTIEHEQVTATDSIITRNRTGRFIFFALAAVAVTILPAILTEKVTSDWFSISKIGFIAGALAGMYFFFTAFYDRMVVNVETQRAFLTLDQLKSFLGKKKAYVAYGPGFHFAYPWELRLARNNVSLLETSEPFEVSVVTTSGGAKVSGSYRIRPRLGTESLVAFVSGVAVIAEDVADLIKSVITELLSTESLNDVSKNIKITNKKLAEEFAEHQSAFEERFGIVVGDVTAAEVALSDGAMKTRNAVDEAKQMSMGVALILGYSDMSAVNEAIANGILTAAQVDAARKQFMMLSDNNVTLDVKDFNVNITGLEHLNPETQKSIADVAKAVTLARQANVKGSKK